MTKKERYIRAWVELIKKFRNPIGNVFFNEATCPLCIVSGSSCRGCPLANKYGGMGCMDFVSAEMASAAIDKALDKGTYKLDGYRRVVEIDDETAQAFNACADALEKYLPVIKNIPSQRFTKEGWTYFDELSRYD